MALVWLDNVIKRDLSEMSIRALVMIAKFERTGDGDFRITIACVLVFCRFGAETTQLQYNSQCLINIELG